MDKHSLSRREFLLASAGTAASVALAACAPKAATTPAAGGGGEVAATPAPVEAVALQWGMYSYEPWVIFLKEMFAKYTEKNPNVTVEVVVAPWDDYWPKVEAMAAAGTPLNVSICEPQYFLPWWERGMLLELTPILETVDSSIFFPQVTCSRYYNPDTKFLGCTSGGKLIPAWPGNGTAHVVYMNLDLLEKSGLEYPSEDWTWDDFSQYCIALTIDKNGKHPGESGYDKQNGDQYAISSGFAFTYGWVQAEWIWHAGGMRWDNEQTKCMLTEDAAMEAITYMYDLGVDKGCAPPPGGFEGIAQPFLTNKIAMEITGTWNVDPFAAELTDFKWDIQRMPVGPGGQDKRLSHTGWGNDLAIFKESKNLEAAKEVFKWAMMTKEGCAYFGRAGIPLVRDAVDDEWLNRPEGKHLPPHREIQIKCVEKENGYNTMEPAGPKDLDLYDVFTVESDKLRLGQTTPEEFATNCCDGFNKVWAATSTG
jgi:multiple sugar transport system substrate-binding protein